MLRVCKQKRRVLYLKYECYFHYSSSVNNHSWCLLFIRFVFVLMHRTGERAKLKKVGTSPQMVTSCLTNRTVTIVLSVVFVVHMMVRLMAGTYRMYRYVTAWACVEWVLWHEGSNSASKYYPIKTTLCKQRTYISMVLRGRNSSRILRQLCFKRVKFGSCRERQAKQIFPDNFLRGKNLPNCQRVKLNRTKWRGGLIYRTLPN